MHMLVALQRPAYAAGNPLALIELPTARCAGRIGRYGRHWLCPCLTALKRIMAGRLNALAIALAR